MPTCVRVNVYMYAHIHKHASNLQVMYKSPTSWHCRIALLFVDCTVFSLFDSHASYIAFHCYVASLSLSLFPSHYLVTRHVEYRHPAAKNAHERKHYIYP